jgi:hypothetical protein
VAVDPALQCAKRLVERPAEVGEFVEGGRLDMARVETANDESVSFCPSERVGEDLVRDAVEGIVEVLVAATALG